MKEEKVKEGQFIEWLKTDRSYANLNQAGIREVVKRKGIDAHNEGRKLLVRKKKRWKRREARTWQ